MSRLLLLLALAVATLVAAAHSGHHAQEQSAQTETGAAPAMGRPTMLVALAAAPCPGDSHEVCSCHELSCMSPAEHAVAADAPAREVLPFAPATRIARAVPAPLPAAPPVSFLPRGPPQLS